MLIVHVALLTPPYATLSYASPDYFPQHSWVKGLRVAVPLGNGLRVGVIMSTEAVSNSNEALELDLDAAPELHHDAKPQTGTAKLCTKNASETPPSQRVAPNTPAQNHLAQSDQASLITTNQATQLQISHVSAPITLKPLLWALERTPLLHQGYLELAQQLALRQTTTIGRILGNLIPQGLRTTQMRIRFFGAAKPIEYSFKDLHKLPAQELIALATLWNNGKAEVVKAGQSRLDTEVCVLQSDPPWPIKPAAKKQIAVLEFLLNHGEVTRRKLQAAFGKGYAATLAPLLERNLVHIRPLEKQSIMATGASFAEQDESLSATPLDIEEQASFDASSLGATITKELAIPQEQLLPPYFTLTEHQQQAYQPLEQALKAQQASTHLLFGITGSGKTAIYLELARACLNMGKSVLLLAPEVALAYKLWGDVSQALAGATRYMFHGYQSPLSKEATYSNTATQASPCLIIGTRSALFLPLKNIGLIVMDEEHDSSFKQDEGFTYQAKEVAWFKAGQEKALLLLGSATPDVKSFFATTQNNLPMVRMDQRAGAGLLPSIKLVQLGKRKATQNLLAEESIIALKETVNKGEQAVILLNRRGYAPILYCLHCNTVAKCPHCDIALAYHKGREKLLCHYCGYSISFPAPCSQCQSMQYLPMGEGTEKVEEYISALLPLGTGVLRLDKDTTRRPGQIEAILDSFARKEAAVLIGTQMLSKGHHFPDVTLAIVADADLGLNLPDYRAAERTFQLLVQSAGRAGRGDKLGTVLIQTRDPSHYCWQHIQNADYEGFFAQEIALRQRRKYPPFVNLALVRLSYPMQEVQAMELIDAFGKYIKEVAKNNGVQVLGPVPSPLPFLQGRRRYQCLIKGQNWQAIRQTFVQAAHRYNKAPLRITLDIDPVNML